MTSQPRLRIAPSPTGQLHVGTARTALYNFLYARHIGGVFSMRIEDTDVARSKREHADAFCKMLGWMGIDWDGDIVYQSDRFDMYHDATNSLLEQGLAYECFETAEELEAINAERKAQKLPPGYDGRARNLTDAQKDELRAAGKPRTVRFATPDEGTSQFEDAIRGTVTVQWASVSDFVIERADGTPTFFLANAADDIDMGITHVVRGEDLIDSTHRVLVLRRALGNADQPFYAHTPMILAPDRSKLSKRHGAVSLESYKEAGFLPEAMVNYLVLLGWAPSDGSEIISMENMIKEFDIHNVNHSGAIFDVKKLEWMNGEYIRAMETGDLIERLGPDARAEYGDKFNDETFAKAVALAQPRATTTLSMTQQMKCLFVDKLDIADDVREQLVSMPNAARVVNATLEYVEKCEWTLEAMDLRELVGALDLKPRKALPIVYIAIEGSTSGLPLFETMFLLGRDVCIARLRDALSILNAG